MAILDRINELNDIKKIRPEDYDTLAYEIRQFILEHVSRTGGHLASNLGCVELTMALHLALDLPKDKIIWDVGHQSYTHKILSGRKDQFDTLRQYGGLSGFPKTYESPADAFDTGHSSTSISAALGFCRVRDLRGTDETVVAVIGDGALSGGLAFEALNNAGQLKSNLIIILNDNKMSISKNVGGMSKYLSKLRVGDSYNEFKGGVEQALLKIPKYGYSIARTVKRSKDSVKSLVVPGMFFEDMGITYVGPIDGHDIETLTRTIESAKQRNRPILIHVRTVKGRGYDVAERHPEHFHGVAPFDLETGKPLAPKKAATYTDVFGRKLVKMAEQHKDIAAITAAMAEGTGLVNFAKKYPERFYDVGIAEEHAVTFAAGMAAAGMKPFVVVYSSFLQRAYDQILHDVCIQKLPVVFCIDRSGLVGPDGDTHQGIFDTAYLTNIPGMTVMAPKNRYELSKMLEFAYDFDGPIAIKYPKGTAFSELKEQQAPLEYGKSELVHQGKKIAVIAVGKSFEAAYQAMNVLQKEDIDITLVNARFIKPIDYEMIRKLAREHQAIITVEDTIYHGGYGQSVAAFLAREELHCHITSLAVMDQFVPHGSIPELARELGIDSEGIMEAVRKYVKPARRGRRQ